MKSPEKTVFEIILVIAVVLAIALLPVAARAQMPGPKGPPAFSDFDKDGDGFVSKEEFEAAHAERHAAMEKEGRPMKGMAMAPKFEDFDADGDGKLSEAEMAAGHQAHMQAMREAHKGMGMHHGMGMRMPAFEDLDLDGNGCISAEEFAKHQAEMHKPPETAPAKDAQ
ncbi:MAG: EF-hand domain-containing protein [Lysobacterales bacterium]|jgi:hypothetical protein